MDKLTYSVINILRQYFKVLQFFGYVNNKEIEYIIETIAIEELFSEKYGKLSENDINELHKIKNCLKKRSCHISVHS